MQNLYFLEMLARQRMDQLMREAERERTMRARLQILEGRRKVPIVWRRVNVGVSRSVGLG